MHPDDADYILDMTAALNAICNAIREHDRAFADITAAVLRQQKDTLVSEKGRDLFQNLIDVLEFDASAGLQ